MIKIYEDIKEFIKDESISNLEYKLSKNCYIVKIYNANCELIAEKGNDSELFVHGDISLIPELVHNMISLGLTFESYLMKKELSIAFDEAYTKILGGYFINVSCPIDKYVAMKYIAGNFDYSVVAGGCFWCAGKPYYEYEGIMHVLSGYTGGNKVAPTYEEVKTQTTHHLEAIKLIYDKSIISYSEILDIYFDTIDPYDTGGQFIDRGESYTTAIFYKNLEEKEVIENYISMYEEKYGKGVSVKVKPEEIFYMAEDYHQDYALKNPELMEKELIESGRKK